DYYCLIWHSNAWLF
nr:immunoglobulin light chain junction region [Macaca mulatta]